MILGFYGKPGSGKTSFLAQFVRSNDIKKKINSKLPFSIFHTYDKIYSTEYVRGTYQIQPYDIGLFKPVENSLFLIHEAGVHFNNRNHKNTPQHCLNFFAVHRHLGCDILYDSQTANVDLQLRSKGEAIYFVRKVALWSYALRIRYDFDVNNETHDIVEGYTKPGLIGKILDFAVGQLKILYRPNVYDYFDSFVDNTQWLYKDDSRYQLYPDDGTRLTWIQKILPLLKILALIIVWLAALVLLWVMIFK